MFDKTVQYTDYDDQKQSATLWFHMNKQDILDNLDLKEQIEEMQHIFTEQKRTLSQLEIKQILELVKRMVRLSYGERSEDRKRFKKGVNNPEVWDSFFESAVYDQFLTDLFVPDPTKSFEFLLAVMPKDLRLQAEAEVKESNPAVYAEYQSALKIADVAEVAKTSPFVADNHPLATPAETRRIGPNDMTREELEAALQAIKNS